MIDDRKKLGNLGERLAARYLAAKGYQIVDKNWRSGRREIDLVAAIGATTVFCEVKTLSGEFAEPAAAIKFGQLQTLRMAIGSYVRQNRIDPDKVRLDLLIININQARRAAKIRHFKKII
jgi:putative endonuclease